MAIESPNPFLSSDPILSGHEPVYDDRDMIPMPVRTWIAWAKNELAIFQRRTDNLKRLEANAEDLCRLEREARNEVVILRSALEKQETAYVAEMEAHARSALEYATKEIAGWDARERRRKTQSTEAHPVGSEVQIKAIAYASGTVAAIHIDRLGVRYDVVYWALSERRIVRLTADEIIVKDDLLPIRPK